MNDISRTSHSSLASSATVPRSSEPRFPSAPRIPDPPGEIGNNVSKFSVWPFRKASNKSRNVSSPKRGAPILERSLSEPNSPTEPTMATARTNRKEGDKPNYIIMARDLLNDTKVRFEGHRKEWSEFYDRYNQLFANGQPIYGKIVKPNTPKPNAQDVAKFLINDIKAVLEDLDKEELMGQFKGKLRTMRVMETAPALPSGPQLRPWFDLSTVNPAVLEKTERHRSINPEGTWHTHSYSRHFSSHFPIHQNRNRIMTRSDPQAPRSGSQRDLRVGFSNISSKDSEGSDVDEWELARINLPRELGKLREKPSSSAQPVEQITEDHRHQSYDSIHRMYRRPQPEFTPQERFTPDPILTPSPPPVPDSPESMNPSAYLLPEFENLGESSAPSVKNKVTRAEIQRPPTFIMYPGPEGSPAKAEKERWIPPASAPAHVSAVTVPETRVPDSPVTGTGVYEGDRRRKRSMSLDHQVREVAIYTSQSRINTMRDRHRDMREKEREYHDRERGSGRERDGYRIERDEYISERERDEYRGGKERDGYRSGRDRDRDRDRGLEQATRNRDYKEKGKGREKEETKTEIETRERTRDGYRDRERFREEDRQWDEDRYRDKYRDRDREAERERDRDRDREEGGGRERVRERERNRDREKDRHASTRNKYDEVQKDYGDPRTTREKDKDNTRRRERDREPEYRDKLSDKERRRERERERDRDKEGDRNKRLDFDYDRRERLAVVPSQAFAGQSTHVPNTMADVSGSASPRKLRSPPVPPSLPESPIPSAVYTPTTAHTMLKYDVARDAVRPPNPNSESRFLEILTSPISPMTSNLPRT
ncbi:hypothetical protein AGABI2DRAFT_115904 [Agaricus bisporus var. bisporus H97]|uniref:hypothetical protein n=1 Tax=Agaricus bisporus var. bisporus (strain H97 / ATCC MYA-4626 / FGSC 10389) TaxID=936046 RepID=UPI00029F6DA8|nr:hypothetical protein AGABI2DRAFT_115904 [Agaricus bisporus var. bisporus H97]EKV48852.1 hypothetical protein AGABI2DRAFT_115904 [Agaricus bisporus var. bisporus H97]